MIEGLRYRMLLGRDKAIVEVWNGKEWVPSDAMGIFHQEFALEEKVEIYVPNDEEE